MDENPLEQELRKYALEQGYDADEFVNYSLAAITQYQGQQTATPEETGEAVVKIEPAELRKITGFSSKLLKKYNEEGITPLVILEMWGLTKSYGTNISTVKQRVVDQDIPLDDMAVILDVRNNLTHHISPKMDLGPGINMLVDIYNRLNNDIDEFQQVMHAIDENTKYASHSLKFIGHFIRLYLNDGRHDLDLTIDILEEEQQNRTRASMNRSDVYWEIINRGADRKTNTSEDDNPS